MNDEGVFSFINQVVAFFRNNWSDDNVARILICCRHELVLLRYIASVWSGDKSFDSFFCEHDVVTYQHIIGIQLIPENGVNPWEVANAFDSDNIFTTRDHEDIVALAELTQNIYYSFRA